MRGVVFTGDRQLQLMTFPDPTPGPDEVVIEMKASGMCGSDLHQCRRSKAGGETGGLAADRPTPASWPWCAPAGPRTPSASASEFFHQVVAFCHEFLILPAAPASRRKCIASRPISGSTVWGKKD
jgi:hypothetical protein